MSTGCLSRRAPGLSSRSGRARTPPPGHPGYFCPRTGMSRNHGDGPERGERLAPPSQRPVQVQSLRPTSLRRGILPAGPAFLPRRAPLGPMAAEGWRPVSGCPSIFRNNSCPPRCIDERGRESSLLSGRKCLTARRIRRGAPTAWFHLPAGSLGRPRGRTLHPSGAGGALLVDSYPRHEKRVDGVIAWFASRSGLNQAGGLFRGRRSPPRNLRCAGVWCMSG